ncbi:SusC/RagA family TonB-linked outer membrane protein [Flavilitoribacter nigricans]|uniref:SusC/RagA family TonB-linked outer membrane protein n=1 Tax=Flavilitoribacter nigricans (strain ATCC 23147 / DSM 23189 / NBRC 102662 / NCIMB 1420 / SS-2) TaxID=1122177 RepID=A0A2D0N331_FLAN2|nr:SusC/RagA family TonB-linked outer membrane protein [Flavilitoribacter nigricans]PHN02905.1 SusC/RagA family TonB-linked outer membrane protein [Flavilitoribacter nigricans DSM 23189 = NBRC 102662]
MKFKQPFLGVCLLLCLFGGRLPAATGDHPPTNAGDRLLLEVLDELSETYEVFFSYENRLLREVRVDFKFRSGESLDSAMNRLLKSVGLEYRAISTKYYVIYQDSKKGKKRANQLERKIRQLKKLEEKGKINLKIQSSNRLDKVRSITESALLLQQEQLVSGTVIDNDGIPLIGATIVEKGTANGTTTDVEGKFQINVGDDAVLTISYVGYYPLDIPVDGRTEIAITMEMDVENLSEVVVVGYGTAKKSDITGSVASFDSKALDRQPANNITELMRSALPGLNVGLSTNAEGSSGLQVRGPTSLGANNSPLLVVDDVIFQGDLSSINPADIESVNVLKDASAAAVYGSRAAAGVIIITTKKGSTGKPTINVRSATGWTQAGVIQDVYGPGEYLDYKAAVFDQIDAGNQPGYYADPNKLPTGVSLNDWLDYDGLVGTATDPQDIWLGRLQLSDIEIANYKAGNALDWRDIIFQTGLRMNNTVSVSGRTENLSYYTSLGYVKNEGILRYQEYAALRGRLNLEMAVTDFLSMGINLQASSQEEPTGLPNHLDIYEKQSPFGDLYYDDGSYRHQPYDDALAVNPLLWEYKDNYYQQRELFSNLFAKVSLPFGLSYRVNWSNRAYFIQDYRFNPVIASIGAGGDAGSRREQFDQRWMVDNILNWNRTLGSHSFDLTFLYNVEKAETFSSSQSNSQFSPNDNLSYHDLSTGFNPSIGSNDTRATADAMMGRLNYGLLDRYYLTLTLRRDGYSAFGSKNPRATFPAVSFAWRLSDEAFLRDSKLIDNLKLRLSWGKNGNRDIGVYSALSRLNGTSYIYGQSTVIGINATDLANADLKWETTTSYNAGLDFGIGGSGRISGSVDVYHSVTNDLLLQRTLPIITGYTDVFANLGEVQNKGLEISLNSVNLNRDGFTWGSNLSFWYNRNKITHLYGDMVDILDANGNVIGQREEDDIENGWYIGHAIDEIFDYRVLGIWQVGEEDEAALYGRVPGDLKIEDVNRDSLINFDDQVFQGYATPRYRLSFRNDITFRQFDLSILMNAFLDYRGVNNEHFNSRVQQQRVNKYITPYWTPDNPSNEWARLDSKNSSPVTRWYDNKSFLRVQNITLGYTMPRSLLEKWNIQSLRLYANVQNLPAFTFGGWNYRWDVETSAPTPLITTLGLDLSF